MISKTSYQDIKWSGMKQTDIYRPIHKMKGQISFLKCTICVLSFLYIYIMQLFLFHSTLYLYDSVKSTSKRQ